ncbi:hypothetical protein ASPTUDRAFT_47824 [Aspergillus tubingensis CBS 134.48]|uniref:Uncharacterized protein n=1 Tax=Aspergillus tubingensis (strain CBS 134.48) TaxID=767770 RepID=A0A1L9MUP6_ASPTC|nr:hypothetical protein ASPTUDRAFT_47824 [Aspergillus tubingensis CBS 134.48]
MHDDISPDKDGVHLCNSQKTREREKSIATAGLVISIFPSRDHVYYGVQVPSFTQNLGGTYWSKRHQKKVDRKSIDITARENVPFFRKSPRMGKALGSHGYPHTFSFPRNIGPGEICQVPFTDG